MVYDNFIFLMYVMFYIIIIININFIKVFMYDKLNYGFKIYIGIDCYWINSFNLMYCCLLFFYIKFVW